MDANKSRRVGFSPILKESKLDPIVEKLAEKCALNAFGDKPPKVVNISREELQKLMQDTMKEATKEFSSPENIERIRREYAEDLAARFPEAAQIVKAAAKRPIDFTITQEEYDRMKEEESQNPTKKKDVATSESGNPKNGASVSEIGSTHALKATPCINNTDRDGYITPTKTAKNIEVTTPNLHTQNRFQELEEISEETQMDVSEEEAQIKPTRPPPIMLSPGQDVIKVLEKLNQEIEGDIVGKKAGNFFKIPLDNHDQYTAAQIILKSMSVEYFTHSTNARPLKVVIRGLPTQAKTSGIKEELFAMKMPIAKIEQMISKRTRKTLPLIEVHLHKCKKAFEIFKISKLQHTNISVEKFRSRNRITTCYRCQGENHIAKNCYIKPKCAKCAKDHNTRDCTQEERKLTCGNCGGNHFSSNKNCPKRPKIVENYPRNRNFSYANALKKNLNTEETPTYTENSPSGLTDFQTKFKNRNIADICTNIFNIVENTTHNNKKQLFSDLIHAIFN